MSFEKEVKLTLIGGIVILSFVASILMFRMMDAQDQVRELEAEVQQLRIEHGAD